MLLNWIEWIGFRTNFIPGFWRYNLMTTYPPLGTTTVSFSGGLSRLRPGIFPFAQSSFAHNEYLHSTSKQWMSWLKFVTSPVVIFTSGKAIFKTWKLWPCIWMGWSVAPLRLSKNHKQIQNWLLIAKHMELVCSKTNQVSFRTWNFNGVKKTRWSGFLNILLLNKKRSMGHIPHPRNQLKSINAFEKSYDYIVT